MKSQTWIVAVLLVLTGCVRTAQPRAFYTSPGEGGPTHTKPINNGGRPLYTDPGF